MKNQHLKANKSFDQRRSKSSVVFQSFAEGRMNEAWLLVVVEVTRAAAAVHSSHPHYLTRGAAAVPRLTADPPPSAASGSQC